MAATTDHLFDDGEGLSAHKQVPNPDDGNEKCNASWTNAQPGPNLQSSEYDPEEANKDELGDNQGPRGTGGGGSCGGA
jgi:hypothetical protein